MRSDAIVGSRRGERLALGLLWLVAAPASSSDWPQFDLDARHGGVSLQETTIHRGNVSTLHVLYNVALPSIADGAPPFLPGVATPLGVKDLLFLSTKDGRILAVDVRGDSLTADIRHALQPPTP